MNRFPIGDCRLPIEKNFANFAVLCVFALSINHYRKSKILE